MKHDTPVRETRGEVLKRFYRSADFPIRAITIMWAQLLVALIVPWACYGFWSPRLPQQVAVHWTGSGNSDQSMRLVGALAIVSVVVLAAGVFSVTLVLCEENTAALRVVAGFLSGFAWAIVGVFTFEMYASLDQRVADASPAATTRPGFALGIVAALCTACFVVRRHRRVHQCGGVDDDTLCRDRLFALAPILLGLIGAAALTVLGSMFSENLEKTLAVAFLAPLAIIVVHSFWRIEISPNHVVVQGIGGWRRLDIPVEEISDVHVEDGSGRILPVLRTEPDLYVICESGRNQVLVVVQRDGQSIRFSSPRAAELERFLRPLVGDV